MGSNVTAVAFLSEDDPAGLDVGLITRTLQCRRAASDPDSLFPLRTILPSQIDACAALFNEPDAALLPLPKPFREVEVWLSDPKRTCSLHKHGP